jgi:hypothetical protein
MNDSDLQPCSLLTADMWKEAMSLGAACDHAGWKAAVWRKSEAWGRIALVKRAARGAERAMLRRDSILQDV